MRGTRYCSVKNCPLVSGSIDANDSFFRAPTDQRLQWEQNIYGFTDGKRCHISLVCHRHFKPEDIKYIGKQRPSLVRGAMPVLNLPSTLTPEDPPKAEVKLVDIESIKNKTNEATPVEIISANQSKLCEGCITKDVQLQGANIKNSELKARIFDIMADNRYYKDRIKYLEAKLDQNGINFISHPQTTDESSETITLNNDPATQQIVKKYFKCARCNKTYEFPEELRVHMQMGHASEFECYLCKTELESLGALKMHFQLHSRDQKCDICKIPLTLNELNHHLCDDIKSIKCEYCPKSFVATIKLLEHLETHEKRRFYRCDKCPKFLPMVTLKEHHMKTLHDKPKKFVCSVCSKAFADRYQLDKHKRTHTAKRTHLCEECGKSYLSASSLRMHKESAAHSQSPTHKCPSCPRKFFNHQDLRHHSDIHKTDVYCCVVCKKELQTWIAYSLHMKRHKRTEADRKFACKLCPLKFFRNAQLKKHQGVHDTVKLHDCHLCEKSGTPRAFKYRRDLVRHLKKDHGEMYECKVDQCSKRFKYLAELQKHEHEHYKEKKFTETTD